MTSMLVNKRQVYRSRMAAVVAAWVAQAAWQTEEKKIFLRGPVAVVNWMFARQDADRKALFSVQWGLSYFNNGMPFVFKNARKLRRLYEALDRAWATNLALTHANDWAAFAGDRGKVRPSGYKLFWRGRPRRRLT